MIQGRVNENVRDFMWISLALGTRRQIREPTAARLMLGYVYALLGEREEALKILSEVKAALSKDATFSRAHR